MLRIPTLIALSFVFIALAAGSGAAQDLPLNTRVKTLNTIFSDYWEDYLKHKPEFASLIGDNRYNDQLADYSVQAYNDSLARDRGFLNRLAEVDTAGMSDSGAVEQRSVGTPIGPGSGGSQVQALGDAGQSVQWPARSIFPSSFLN